MGQKDRRNGTGCQERYVAADQLEAEVEDLYGRIEVPDDWAEGLREAVAAEVATRHEDTTAERDLLATQHERLESERYKLMEAYYANAIDVTMLRREQERIGAELRAIESRQATLDASLEDWQEVMDLALRFSTRCATAYRRAGDRTRRLLNAAVLDEVHVRDGHVVDAAYKEPFDLLFSSPKFEYDDVVRSSRLGPTRSVARRPRGCPHAKRSLPTLFRAQRRRGVRGSDSTIERLRPSSSRTRTRRRRSLSNHAW